MDRCEVRNEKHEMMEKVNGADQRGVGN